MSKIQVQTEIDLDKLLNQLDTEALERLLKTIPQIIGQRKSDEALPSESYLLEQLNHECKLPDEHWKRFRILSDKKEEGSISEDELNELLSLVREEERLRAHRISILGKLAQAKGMSLVELSNELGLNPA